MTYTTLLKEYYTSKDRQQYESVYQERFAKGVHLGIDINDNEAFYLRTPEIFERIIQVLKQERTINTLAQSLPGIALKQYANRCLIDEIMLTNEIEGVRSTRRELGEILSGLKKQDKKNRFFGLVMEYKALQTGGVLSLSTSEDVRHIYDLLFLDEVRLEDPEDVPDGKIFRAGPVSVTDRFQRDIHQGIGPEEKIISYMDKALAILNDDSIDILIRVSIFHYLFGYIHPFYEGNGRMSRFISSYMVSQELNPLLGYRISYYIKEHIKDYYKAFEECNDSRNRGDLTPFILFFTGVVLGACEQLKDEIAALTVRYERYKKLIPSLSDDEKMRDLYGYLIQAMLFSDIGISTKMLLELTDVTRSTLAKRLKTIDDAGLLITEKRGTEKFYMTDFKKIEAMSVGE